MLYYIIIFVKFQVPKQSLKILYKYKEVKIMQRKNEALLSRGSSLNRGESARIK